MRCRFVLVPICLDTELSFSMGAEMSWSRTVLLPSSPDYDILISTLEAESQVPIDWFKDNKMQANPDKFQVLAVGKKTFAKNPSIQIQNNILSCEETVKLLGIDIDYQLKFD